MTFATFKANLLENPEVRKHYEALEPDFKIAKQLIELRRKAGLSQRELSSKTGIKQPQLARIEKGKQLPKLDTIASIASSLGYSVELSFIPKSESKDTV